MLTRPVAGYGQGESSLRPAQRTCPLLPSLDRSHLRKLYASSVGRAPGPPRRAPDALAGRAGDELESSSRGRRGTGRDAGRWSERQNVARVSYVPRVSSARASGRCVTSRLRLPSGVPVDQESRIPRTGRAPPSPGRTPWRAPRARGTSTATPSGHPRIGFPGRSSRSRRTPRRPGSIRYGEPAESRLSSASLKRTYGWAPTMTLAGLTLE
jgi:hypothetical protein